MLDADASQITEINPIQTYIQEMLQELFIIQLEMSTKLFQHITRMK